MALVAVAVTRREDYVQDILVVVVVVVVVVLWLNIVVIIRACRIIERDDAGLHSNTSEFQDVKMIEFCKMFLPPPGIVHIFLACFSLHSLHALQGQMLDILKFEAAITESHISLDL